MRQDEWSFVLFLFLLIWSRPWSLLGMIGEEFCGSFDIRYYWSGKVLLKLLVTFYFGNIIKSVYIFQNYIFDYYYVYIILQLLFMTIIIVTYIINIIIIIYDRCTVDLFKYLIYIYILYALGWFKKTQFCGNQLLFDFLNLHVEKKFSRRLWLVRWYLILPHRWQIYP